MKKLIALIILSLILVSCWSNDNDIDGVNTKDIINWVSRNTNKEITTNKEMWSPRIINTNNHLEWLNQLEGKFSE